MGLQDPQHRDHPRIDTQRVETSLAARISTDDGALIDCTIRDLSESGAKIEVADMVLLGPEFTLKIQQSGEILRAEVRWRYANKLGVRFIRPEPAGDHARSRESLLAENRRLWETLEAMATRLTQLGEHVALPSELRRPSAPSLTAADPALLAARETSTPPLP